jgi:hypothetical protein
MSAFRSPNRGQYLSWWSTFQLHTARSLKSICLRVITFEGVFAEESPTQPSSYGHNTLAFFFKLAYYTINGSIYCIRPFGKPRERSRSLACLGHINPTVPPPGIYKTTPTSQRWSGSSLFFYLWCSVTPLLFDKTDSIIVESPVDTIMNDERLLLSELVTTVRRNDFRVEITKYLSYFPSINQLFRPKLQLHKYLGMAAYNSAIPGFIVTGVK